VARRLVRRALEVRVAEAAIAAAREQHAHAGFGEVCQDVLAVFIEHLRADRHAQHHVLTAGAGAVPAHAVAAGLRLVVLQVAVIDQRVQAIDGLDPDIAALAAVAAVGSAVLDELLAPERHGPRAAVAGADEDLGLVEKFHEVSLPVGPRRRISAAGLWRISFFPAPV
jgi:hypothetical protein